MFKPVFLFLFPFLTLSLTLSHSLTLSNTLFLSQTCFDKVLLRVKVETNLDFFTPIKKSKSKFEFDHMFDLCDEK